MTEQMNLMDAPMPVVEPEAHARRTDPSTSHEAARSLGAKKLNANRLAVLRVLGRVEPKADEEWMAFYEAGEIPALPRQSPSGLRSRRADLVEMLLVEAVGETLIRNRRCITWGLTAAGRSELGL